MDVPLPLQRARPQRVGDGDPGGSRPSEQVHLRLHGDRRGFEVRAQLGLHAVGQDDQAWVFDATATAAWAPGSWRPSISSRYYDICTKAARAAYCQDEKSYTKNGTLVDLFDTRQIIWPNAIENPFSASNEDSLWMMAQEYFISHGPEPAAVIDEGLGAAAHALPRAVADRRVRQPLVHRPPRARPHRGRALGEPADEHAAPPGLLADLLHARRGHEGDALPWDCSPCTTQVCKTMPACCGAGLTPGWTAACNAQAAAVVQGRAGRVAPREGLADAIRRRHERTSWPSSSSVRGAPSPRRWRERFGIVGHGLGLGLRSGVAGRHGRGARSTGARRGSRWGACCSARCAPIRRWRRRWRAR